MKHVMDLIKTSVIAVIFASFSYMISGVDLKVGARADNTYFTRTSLNINLLKNQNDLKMSTLGNLVPTFILIHSVLPTLVGNHFILFQFCV